VIGKNHAGAKVFNSLTKASSESTHFEGELKAALAQHLFGQLGVARFVLDH
jgi:hypothetical protein